MDEPRGVARAGHRACKPGRHARSKDAAFRASLSTRFAGEGAWRRFLMGAVFLGDVVKNAYQEAKGDSIVQGR
jgi:hypothetical protein